MTLVHWATESDLPFINKVMNHEDIHPWVSPYSKDPITIDDLSTGHYGVCSGGVFLGKMSFLDTMDCHLAFMPEQRGMYAHACGVEALRMTFTETMTWDCISSLDKNNKGAKNLIDRFGFKFMYESEKEFHYHLNWREWIFEDPELPIWGAFIFPELGRNQKEYAVLGMLALCIRYGFKIKGVDAYCRMQQAMRLNPLTFTIQSNGPTLTIAGCHYNIDNLEKRLLSVDEVQMVGS